MFRFPCLPCRLLQHHLPWAYTLLNHSSVSSSKAEAGKPSKNYDLSEYKFPYSPTEIEQILTVLNQSTEEDFLCYKIGKGIAKKLIGSRNQIVQFDNVHQMLEIEGLGIKKVEKICDKLLMERLPHDDSDDENVSKSLIDVKRLIKPKVPIELKKSVQTLLAVDLMIGNLSWTLLDRRGTVLDVGTAEIVTADKQIHAPDLYDMVHPVVRNLPEADIYLCEERYNFRPLQRAPLGTLIIALKSAQVQGIVTSLIESRNVLRDCRRLFYVRDVVASRLFNLIVGKERISGLQLADDLMKGEKCLDWLPPLTVDEGTLEKYFSLKRKERKLISFPLFVGLGFCETVLLDNTNALLLFK